jgi:hypothetical protein
MKKQLIISALSLFSLVALNKSAQAQTSPTTATATVNIELADAITIAVGAPPATGFKYLTAADYNSTKYISGDLTVTSTKVFDVSVKANDANFSDGTNSIPVSVLKIRPVQTAGTAGGLLQMGGTPTTVVLSNTSDQEIITGAPLGSALVLGIEYEIPAAQSSSAAILGKPVGNYTVDITYTATAN